MEERRPIIAIVGRPNVGKSTLFNRLIGKRKAITSRIPGTTRDRIYESTHFGPYEIVLVDTGGLDFEETQQLETDVQLQARIAILEADLIYFVIDATQELTSSDFAAASLLRKTQKPVFLIAHKADSKKVEEYTYNLFELGFGEPFQISSIHIIGLDRLILYTIQTLKRLKWKPVKPKTKIENRVDICFLGKPNVGKSALVNALLGEERVIVSQQPGTTIDTIDTILAFDHHQFTLIDTAGVRRRGKVKVGIEKWSVLRSLEAVRRCDIALLIMDAKEGIGRQDCHVSHYVLEAGKGLILVVNKTDLMGSEKEEKDWWIRELQAKMSYVPWAPVLFTSAKTKKNLTKIFDLAMEIHKERASNILQKHFEIFLQEVLGKHSLPGTGKSAPKIFSGKQTGVEPPEFTFYSNNPDAIHFSYRRYLENQIREKFGFTGTAINLVFKRIKSDSTTLI